MPLYEFQEDFDGGERYISPEELRAGGMAFDAGIMAVMAADIAAVESVPNDAGGHNAKLWLYYDAAGELLSLKIAAAQDGQRLLSQIRFSQVVGGQTTRVSAYANYGPGSPNYVPGVVYRTGNDDVLEDMQLLKEYKNHQEFVQIPPPVEITGDKKPDLPKFDDLPVRLTEVQALIGHIAQHRKAGNLQPISTQEAMWLQGNDFLL